MRVVYDRLGKRTGAPPFLRLPELWKERVERMENAKKKSRKKKVLIWVLIVLLALAGGGWYAMKRMNDAMQTAASAQNTYTVTRGNVSVTITGSGKLETPDTADVTLPVGVKVDTLFVKEGDSVKAGDVLAALDGDSLQYRAAELSSELAALDQQTWAPAKPAAASPPRWKAASSTSPPPRETM